MSVQSSRPGWTTMKFSDFVENVRDPGSPTPEDSSSYIGLEDLDSGALHIRRWGAAVDLKGDKLRMKKGDLLFAKRNAYLRRVAIAPHDGYFSAHGMVLRPKPARVSPDFLPFFLQSDAFMNRAIEISVGSLSPTINWGTLREQEFALPPIEEQKRIAELLWAADDAVVGVSALLDRVEKGFSTALAVRFSEHSGDPRGLVRLDELCTRLPQSGIYKGEKYCGHGTKIVKMGQLFANDVIDDGVGMDRMELTDVEIQRYCLTANDLLFGRRSIVLEGAGKCTLVGDIRGKIAFESSILRVSLDPMKAKSGFVFSWFKSPGGKKELRRIRSFTTVAGITGSDLRHVRVPRLPLGGQETISALSQRYRDEVAAVGLHARKTRDLMTSIREALLGGDRHVR